ncbi:MAG TPA: hypothetical protein ENN53_04395, partial [Candidatus Acetothermia bacterium]|nr:hypothetical protein [Candidatus Acetothermia bacterium]
MNRNPSTVDRRPSSAAGRGPRIGVFVCHCGKNIATTVDVPRVVEALARHPGVAYAAHHEYMCSDPGQ